MNGKETELTNIDFDKLAQDMGHLAEGAVLDTVRVVVAEQPELVWQVMEALTAGMDIVGEKFDDFEYYVGDLIVAGDIFTQALEMIKQSLEDRDHCGEKVILATVEGDLHDIGKKMVKAALEAKQLQVVDLGVNVAASSIVKSVQQEGAKIVALSGVLTFAVDAMEQTIQALKKAGIRERVKVVVGGQCMSREIAQQIGADRYGKAPQDTAAICQAWALSFKCDVPMGSA